MNLALFDFDGTITTREMFPDFIHHAVAPRRLALGRLVLAPLIAGYRLGLVSGNTVRASIVNFGFRGVPESRIRDAGREFARDVLPRVLRPHAMERIQWHKAQGDRIIVVSGALDLYLAHWCRQHDLELMCSALESRAGVLTGRYLGAQCVGMEKPRRVRETLDLRGFPIIYAYGDTREDLDLLRIAHRKVYRWEEAA